jgi:hypothetical protein
VICERCGTVFCWDEADEYAVHGRKLYCSKVCARKAGKRRQQVRQGSPRRRRHLESSLAACAEQGKRQYPDSERAQAAAAAVLSRTGQPLRAYRCAGTGHWHLTSLSSNHSRMRPDLRL